MMFIPEGGARRIIRAATIIKLTIYLIGSRANGTAKEDSDFDYIIPSINNKKWRKIKNSLPGAKSTKYDLPNRIDLLKIELDSSRPFLTFKPSTPIDER